MARIGLFVAESTPLFAATEAGVWKHGHTSCAQHAGAWSPRQANARDFSGVVIHGNRGGSGQIAEWYGSRRIAVVMVDLPHLRGHAQVRVSPPDHAWVPEGDRPGDRLAALGIEYGERGKSKAVCILGQLGNDASHGMTSGQLKEWATGAAEKLRALSDAKLIWRCHPLDNARWSPAGVDEVVDRSESLAATLERCGRVVTWCSTGGLEALISGLPVVAEGASVYRSLSGSIKYWAATAKPPSRVELDAVLARIAYTQWGLDEIASGEAFAQVGGDLFDGLDFAPAVAEPVEPAGPEPEASTPEDEPEAMPGSAETGDIESETETIWASGPTDATPTLDPESDAADCPHCGKKYKSRNHWFEDHVETCEAA